MYHLVPFFTLEYMNMSSLYLAIQNKHCVGKCSNCLQMCLSTDGQAIAEQFLREMCTSEDFLIVDSESVSIVCDPVMGI